jgi:apolipoprotein N-acyltransferase
VLSGLLLFAAWPPSPLTPLIFVACVPLFWIEQQGIRRKRFFGWVYLSMLIWNGSTTWWIWNASEPGAAGAIIANSLLMCLPWLGFHWVKKKLGARLGYLSLVCFWMSFEYIHLHDWGLSWPWLTLGNAFSFHPDWIQWYSITGTSGGTCWVLFANVLIVLTIRQLLIFKRRSRRPAIWALVLIFSPFLISVLVEASKIVTIQAQWRTNVVIVQPDFDPYEKIATGTFDSQLATLIRLSESAIDSNTRLVVWPETALYMENGIDEDHMKDNRFLGPLWGFLHRHPQINLFSGVEGYRVFTGKQTASSHPIPNTDKYFDTYNSAVLFDSSGPVIFYHKSMLVPGVETLPSFLHFMDSWFEKFGGTTGGYAGQRERTVSVTSNNSYHIAPAVCYESIYGEFMSAYVRNGADVIAVITNDGWWGNTPGYEQHESYARFRAIETDRFVVRSANTGISCVIDPSGHEVESLPWFKEGTIKMNVPELHDMTFFVRFGDILSELALLGGTAIFFWTLLARFRPTHRHKKTTEITATHPPSGNSPS